ncbi:MAG: DCC1-like thiol-disulfide oxidoreductase family protein [Bacteroidota bacterium]
MDMNLNSLEDIMALTKGKPLLLFDGVCNLCADSVQFVIERDPKGRILFASLQSDLGQRVVELAKLQSAYLNTVVLIDNGKVYKRSAAAMRTTKFMKGAWPAFRAFLIVPEFIRDAIYELIANNRYKWFGKKEVCWMPTPELKARFLD